MKNRSAITALAITLFLTQTAPALAAQPNPSDMYVVMYRADWCGPCKIVEPALQKALKTLDDPDIHYITFDFTTSARQEISANKAFDHQIVSQYNQWFLLTGFAAIIDADTKNTLGCVNLMYDSATMTQHIRNLKTYAAINKPSVDLTCPQSNRSD